MGKRPALWMTVLLPALLCSSGCTLFPKKDPTPAPPKFPGQPIVQPGVNPNGQNVKDWNNKPVQPGASNKLTPPVTPKDPNPIVHPAIPGNPNKPTMVPNSSMMQKVPLVVDPMSQPPGENGGRAKSQPPLEPGAKPPVDAAPIILPKHQPTDGPPPDKGVPPLYVAPSDEPELPPQGAKPIGVPPPIDPPAGHGHHGPPPE